MNGSIRNYFDLAGQIATMKQDDNRNWSLGSVAVRGDGVIVCAPNGPTPMPDRRVHSEYRVCKKIDAGATLYVARVLRADQGFATARPCIDCRKVIISRRVKRVYYTINNNSYGIWNVERNSFSERTF